jgi:hypothetical protein
MPDSGDYASQAWGAVYLTGLSKADGMLSNSTVSEQPFLYIQWSQAITLFPMIQTCKFIAL